MIRWSKIIILAHTLTAVLQIQKLKKADQCENQTFVEVVNWIIYLLIKTNY